MRLLFIGDIVGRPGRQVLHQKLPGLVRERKIDLVIANAENIAGGSGITQNLFHKIRRTSGTAVAKASGSLAAAQAHLGHSDPATTLAYVDPTQTETDKLKWLTDLRD